MAPPEAVCCASPARSARSLPAEIAGELGVRLQVQRFLDDWHYNAVHSCAAKTWDRRRALRAALDLLEINGIVFPKGEKEKCLDRDNEAVADCILENMPSSVQAHFEVLSQQLQSALRQISRARRALEVGEEEGLRAICEVDDDFGISRKVLRNSVVVAAKEVAKTIDTHGSWRKQTEARLERLTRAAEDAEQARQELLATETQINDFGYLKNQKTRACLMGLAAGQDQAVLHTSFATWHGVMLKAKADQEIRKKFEGEVREAEERLFKLKEKHLGNVRASLARQHMDSTSQLLSQSFAAWLQVCDEVRKDGVTKEQLQEVQKKLEQAEKARKANMTKVVSKMCGDTVAGVLQGALIAWTKAVEDAKQEKDLEQEVKKVQGQVKEHLDSHKLSATSVVARLGTCSNEGLLQAALRAWLQQSVEERQSREMQSAMNKASKQFDWLKDRQFVNAVKVQGRVNRQCELFMCMKIVNAWLLVTKVERVGRHFTKKLDSKRKQLTGVQTLFAAFAKQLDQGLGGVEEGEESARATEVVPMPRKPDRKIYKKVSSRGESTDRSLHKGKGSFSLPDIRQGHAWKDESHTRRER